MKAASRLHFPLLSSTIRPWLKSMGLLVSGMFPCPECGIPILWHVWPLMAILIFSRMMSRRRDRTASGPLDRMMTDAGSSSEGPWERDPGCQRQIS